MDGAPTYSSALAAAEIRLDSAQIDFPRAQAFAMLTHVTGLSRASLLVRLGESLEASAATAFARLVDLRAAHHPLQYLLGSAGFLDFDVRVGPGVFIPRPETEQLVETAVELWNSDHAWAIDLCTGSGAIAIALARARPQSRVLALDLSPIALKSAQASAIDLDVRERILFVRADLLAGIAAASGWSREVGVVVCNPPYAPRADVVQPEVRDHEPELAWSPGPTGLESYARLIPQAAEVLAPGRPLLLELGFGQHASVPRLLAEDGRWTAPRSDPDFQGIPRVLSAYRR